MRVLIDRPAVFAYFDRADRAGFRAGAAIDTFRRIDLVFAVTFADRADRAFAFAGAAGYAVVRNHICHRFFLLHSCYSASPGYPGQGHSNTWILCMQAKISE